MLVKNRTFIACGWTRQASPADVIVIRYPHIGQLSEVVGSYLSGCKNQFIDGILLELPMP